MTAVSFDLIHGLKVGDIVHKAVTLKDLTAADLMEAYEAAEKVHMTPGGAELLPSPMKLSLEILRRQIAGLGGISMPLSESEFNRLNAEDIVLLQGKAKSFDAVREVAARGRA